MRRGAPAGLAVAALACLLAAPHGALAATVNPSCGGDLPPACPSPQSVVPGVIATPVHDVTVAVLGTDLGGVTDALLEPGDQHVDIVSVSPTEVDIKLPDGLDAQNYSIQLRLDGQTTNFQSTPFFEVTTAGAGGALPAFTFAPAPPVAQATATAPAATPAPATAAPAASSNTRPLLLGLAIFVLFVAGSVAGLTLRRRRLLRRTEDLGGLALAAMDRELAEIWRTGEMRTAPAMPQPTPVGAAVGGSAHDRTDIPRYTPPRFAPRPRPAPAVPTEVPRYTPPPGLDGGAPSALAPPRPTEPTRPY